MAQAYTLRTLEMTPEKALAFFAGLRDKKIRAAVQKHGLGSDVITSGRERLIAVIAGEDPDYPDGGAAPADPGFAEVVSWDERHFAVLEAAITYYAPEVAAWVFDGQSPQADQPGSIQVVATVLHRVKAVLSGAPGAPPAPAILVAGLEKLGYGEAERQRLDGLVIQALTPEALDGEDDEPAVEEPPADATRLALLLDLRRWYDLAAAIARKSGLNRGQLIRLGLAQRKSPKAATTPPVSDPEVPVA